MLQKRALVLGAGGFIGHHTVRRLKAEGVFVRGADRKRSEFDASPAQIVLVAKCCTQMVA